MVHNRQLIDFLRSKSVNSGFLDRIKVSYRPLICPFNDLINMIGDKNLSVADIGCGSGQFALLLAEFTNVSDIYGIEINPRLIANATALLESYPLHQKQFEVYDGKTLPTKISKFDQIYMIDVFHHIPKKNQGNFLIEMFKVIRSGADLIIKDIDGGSPGVLINKLHDLIFSREVGHEWSIEKLCRVAEQIGFRIKEKKTRMMFGYPHFTVVLTKD